MSVGRMSVDGKRRNTGERNGPRRYIPLLRGPDGCLQSNPQKGDIPTSCNFIMHPGCQLSLDSKISALKSRMASIQYEIGARSRHQQDRFLYMGMHKIHSNNATGPVCNECVVFD